MEELYYKIFEKYYSYEYIKNNFKTIFINYTTHTEEFIKFENILYSLNIKDLKGSYEIINDILIIQWDNILVYYELKNNMYEPLIIPQHFDCNFYLKNINKYNGNTKNNWNYAICDYFIYGRKNNIPFSKNINIMFNKILQNAIINETHEHIFIENNYYKYNTIDDNKIKIYLNPIIFDENNHYHFYFNYEAVFIIYSFINDIFVQQ